MTHATPYHRAPDHRERNRPPSPAPIPYHGARAIIAAAVDLQRATSADAMGRTPQTCAALLGAAKRAALAQLDHDAEGFSLIAHPAHLASIARTCAAWLEGWNQRPEQIARRAQIAEQFAELFGEDQPQ